MSNEDFAKVEQELHTNFTRARAATADTLGGESDFFYSMGPGHLPPLDMPPVDTEMQSIPLGGGTEKHGYSPGATSSRRHTHTNKHTALQEDQIVVQLNVRYVAVTLLHQNLTNVSVSGDLDQPTVSLSNKYFSEVAGKLSNNYETDASTIRASLNKVCPHDHLFMVCVNTSFRLELMTSASHINSSTSLSIVRCEIEEMLYSSLTQSNLSTPNIFPVVLLDQRETRAMSGSIYHPTTPALQLITKSSTVNDSYKTRCSLDLGSLSVIADISLFDRVGVFHKSSNGRKNVHLPTVSGQDLHLPTASMVRQDIYDEVMGENSGPTYEETFTSTCHCNHISVTLRFPIPDMRPAAQRTWWAPALRADYVIMHIEQANLEYNIARDHTHMGAQFLKMNCEYLENSDADPISFLMAGQLEDDPDTKPRIVMRMTPAADTSLLVRHSPSPPPSLDNILNMPDSKPSPFASKRVMYESHELIMPGSKTEMDAFEETVKENSLLSLEFFLPEVLIYLQDKQFFEILYNRIFTDLMLWTAGCPVAQETNLTLEPDIFKMCTSTAHREADSDDEEEEADIPIYKTSNHSNSWLSLSFNFSQCRISLNCTVPPTPEQGPLHANPTGEVLLEMINTHLFTVVEHEGDPNTSFFSMYADNGTLYHGNNSPTSMSTSTLTASSINSALNEILYTLPPHLRQYLPNSNKDYSFLHIASKMYFDQTRNIKEITLALAFQNICHRYYMKPREENFALQLIEFFNVQDYTVPGYRLPLSVTSLHSHLWNLAVDYRPLYLPWSILATVHSLGVSSNLALESAVTSLRVLMEDFTFYLAPGQDSPDSQLEDYVKLMDLDLFELMIKMLLITPTQTLVSPPLEIEVKNNLLQVSTCADSCAALRDVLLYCTCEGDLYGDSDWTRSSSCDSLPRTTRVREHSSSDDIPSLVKSAVRTDQGQRKLLTQETEEAIAEEEATTDNLTPAYSKQTFTFPDDQTSTRISLPRELPGDDLPVSSSLPVQVSSVTEGLASAMLDEDSDDQEFFLIESELVETTVAKGQFVIKQLVETPVILVENHFSLPRDTDQLKAPAHFPVPISRITVKEVSLQWNMYGGNDFPATQTRSAPSTPRSDRSRSSESGGRERKNSQLSHEVGRNKAEQMEFQISKMKMRFEQYPDTAQQIFRLCTVLTDVEIKDKMGSSNFNKFLYQYSTDENPRPSRTPMFCVKVVHNRTEERTEDAIIRVSILPLRFNIDQDALLFMFNFFNTVSEHAPYRRVKLPTRSSPSVVQQTPLQTTKPVTEETFGFGKSSAVVGKTTARAVADRDSLTSSQLMTSSNTRSDVITPSQVRSTSTCTTHSSNTVTGTAPSDMEPEETPAFIKAFIFSPEVPIRVDYKGKNVRGDKNLISNPVTNLLIGLAQLNCSELRLRSLCYRQGLLGYGRLLEWVTLQWINDIKTSQLPSILGGVGPMHSFIQLFSGVVDLFYLPIQQYREDGRIVRGLQRGANSFTHSTAVSLLQLTSKLFSSIQCVAEVTYDLVSPSQHKRSSPSFQHPADLREGLVNAYQAVTTDISTRASSIQHAAVYNHSTKGITSAVGGVLREIPPTLLLPFITLPKVITNLSNGAQNHLKPSTLKEREEKYRT